MPKSYTYKEAKSAFEEKKCVLLESTYKNNHMPMKYICECGEKGVITLKSMLKGRKCKSCGINKRASSKRKWSIEDIRQILEKEKYTLLESEYISCEKPLRYRCPLGHIGKTNWSNFKRGHRCKICSQSGSNGNRWNPDREQVRYNALFRKKCYGFLYRCLYATNQKKNSKTKDMLGYSTIELKEHIEKQSNWNDIKNEEWHLDHIFPIKAFIDRGINDLKIINSLSNLRACKAKDNLSKSGKYDESKFKKWLSNHSSS